MTIVIIGKWLDPKPGYELRYMLAWKHRAIMGHMMLRADMRLMMFWRPWRYARIWRLWADAVDRTKKYGQE